MENKQKIQKKESKKLPRIKLYKDLPLDFVKKINYYHRNDSFPVLEIIEDISGDYFDFKKLKNNIIYSYVNFSPSIITIGDKVSIAKIPIKKISNSRCACKYIDKDIMMIIPFDLKIILFYNFISQKCIYQVPFIEGIIYEILKINVNTYLFFGNDNKKIFVCIYDLFSYSISSKTDIDEIDKIRITGEEKIFKINEEVILIKLNTLFYFFNWKKKVVVNIYEKDIVAPYPFVCVDTELCLFYEYPFDKLPPNKQKIKVLHLENTKKLFDFSFFPFFVKIGETILPRNSCFFLYRKRFLFFIFAAYIFIYDSPTKELIWGIVIQNQLSSHKICGNNLLIGTPFLVFKINNKNLLSLV